jgi:hypothetical protein
MYGGITMGGGGRTLGRDVSGDTALGGEYRLRGRSNTGISHVCAPSTCRGASISDPVAIGNLGRGLEIPGDWKCSVVSVEIRRYRPSGSKNAPLDLPRLKSVPVGASVWTGRSIALAGP